MQKRHAISSFRDLKVWQLGIEITEQVYNVSRTFPKEELYGLTSQLRRAAVSVPANIAEGHAGAFSKEYQRHLSIAIGSLAEVETYLDLCLRLSYGNPKMINELQKITTEERQMLRGLQRALRTRSTDTVESLTPDPRPPDPSRCSISD
jgi:four helix bundle protein